MSPVSDVLVQQLSKVAVSALGRAPSGLQRAISTVHHDQYGTPIEPEVGAALRLMSLDPNADFSRLPVEDGRRLIDDEATLFGGRRIEMGELADLTIPGPGGDIPARYYLAPGADRSRMMIYLHGGGWVLGSLTSGDSCARFISEHAGIAVLSVDYRLAPEHPFPAAPDDVLAVFDHLVENAATYGVDPRRIAVGGDSAGGNLAAVLCLDAVRRGGPAPCFQLLVYPATDFTTERPSREEFREGYFLTARQMDWYADHYVPTAEQRADWRASPLLAPDLSGVAPAYVAVAGFDVLRDEGEAYAHRLRAAGVPTALRRHSGLIHGFANATGVGHASKEAMLEACGALRLGVA